MNISKQSELLEMYNTTLRRGSNPIIVMNVKTSNLKPVPKIYRHTHDENMSLVTVNCKSAVNKTVAISVVRHSTCLRQTLHIHLKKNMQWSIGRKTDPYDNP